MQSGDKAEMEIGERMTSKQNASSAINRAHAKVSDSKGSWRGKIWWRGCERFLQWWAHKLRTVRKVTFQLTTKPLPLPTKPAWTLIFSLEGYYQPNHWVTLSPSPLPTFLSSRPRLRALSSASQVALATFSSRSEVRVCGICFLAWQGRRKQQVALIEKQQPAEEIDPSENIKYRNVVYFFPLKPHSTSSLTALGELAALENCSMGNTSLRSTAMAAWPAGTKEGVSELNPCPCSSAGSQGNQFNLIAEESTVLHCLYHRNTLKEMWPSKEQASIMYNNANLYVYLRNQS